MRYNYRKNYITAIVKKDMPYYLASFIFLFAGIVIGSVAVRLLEYDQKKELVIYMNKFFNLVTEEDVSSLSILLQAIKNNFQTVFFIWILSITVIGIPFTLFMVSFRGFVTGFTVAFFIDGFGFKGLLFSIIAVLPQNLILIICTLVLSAISLKYSLSILKRNFSNKNISKSETSILNYTILTSIIFIAMNISAVIEAFLSSSIIKLVSDYFIIK